MVFEAKHTAIFEGLNAEQSVQVKTSLGLASTTAHSRREEPRSSDGASIGLGLKWSIAAAEQQDKT